MTFKRLKIGIGKKLALSYLAILVLFGAFFYFISLELQKRVIDEIVSDKVGFARASFEHTKQRDINMLSSTLETIVKDPQIKQLYLEKDRSQLYDYNEALFKDLKEKYGITHWYFISPDGTTFLRMHQPELYGDEIKRFTLKEARGTGKLASGIELGKTAYALRVVMPYYQDNELIGYVELGEEINHFLKILKSETNNEDAIVADKNYLNADDWASSMRLSGLRNNWDDLEEHLLVSSTSEANTTRNCFTEKHAEQIEQGLINSSLLQKEGGKSFGCGGFEIRDASGAHSGSVMLLVDVSEHMVISKEINGQATKYLLIISGLILVAGMLFSRAFAASIRKLSSGAAIISQGNLDYRVDLKTGDEIEQLGNDFNEMADKLDKSHTKLEGDVKKRTEELEKARTGLREEVAKRTKELEEAKNDVEKQVLERTAELNKSVRSLELMNKAMSDRELKMVELKKKIKELEAGLGSNLQA